MKRKKLGAKTKAKRENHGTTASFPLTGAIPSLKAGRPVKASSIIVPARVPSAASRKAAAAKTTSAKK